VAGPRACAPSSASDICRRLPARSLTPTAFLPWQSAGNPATLGVVSARHPMQEKPAIAGRIALPDEGDRGDTSADMDDWLTRGEVAAVMRVSITTVRRLQGRELHPRRSPDGFYLFDPREVEVARARRPPQPDPRECGDAGELAAETFKFLRDGVDIRDVVIALRRPTKEIEALYVDWERMGDMLVISKRTRGQLARLVRHGLLSGAIAEAIEDDDAETLGELVANAIKAKTRQRAG
jgi:hypothetical protein